MEIHLKVIGLSFIVLSLIHIIFPKYFNWKEELKELSLMNKQMMGVHTFFIALFIFLIGLLLLNESKDLITTHLGNIVMLGLAIFWTTRFVFQLFVYSSKLWKGKVFETSVHIFFTFYWMYISSVFWLIYLK